MSPSAPAPGRGIALMLGAILGFTIMDATAKAIAGEVGVVMTLWARYLGQTLVVAAIVLPRGPAVLRSRYPGLQVLRSVFLLMATTFFFSGLVHIGLAEATAIMDINPVLITLGAALFLGERFGPRRAIGVAVSLIGALIIIRPGTEVFSPAGLLPLCAAVCYSGYALTTRFVGRDEDAWTSLFYTALFGAGVLCVAVPFFWQTPDAGTGFRMLVIGAMGAAGQFLLIRALQEAEASIIAPFGYAGLVFATFWGLIFFGEVPDAATVTGMVVIVAAGLYVWHRETRPAKSGLEPGTEAEPCGTQP